MPYRARIAPALALCAIFALVATFVACGGQDGASAAAGTSSGPRAFADESYAELATDGDNLWLAVTGYRRSRAFGLKVFEKEGSEWVELRKPPGEVSGDLPVSLVVTSSDESESVPCLGYSTARKHTPVVACLEDGYWKQKKFPVRAAANLIQLGAEDPGLNALMSEGRDTFRLLREVNGEWVTTPRLPKVQAIAQLAIEGSGDLASPAVGLATQRTNAKHLVYELRGESWRRLKPSVDDVGVGPLLGGPVLTEGRVLYPVNQADSQPWSFSVQSARLGSTQPKVHRLSAGAGNAQGQLDLADGRIWASWQEDAPLKDGRFRAAIYAAELSSGGRVKRKVRLWRGMRIGPGSTQVLAFDGKTLALYMRSSSNGRGLQATIETLP
jgi:hypothetical protein